MRQANKATWLSSLNSAEKYLISLQTTAGVPLYQTKRKTAIFGDLIMIQNVKSIFEEYIGKKNLIIQPGLSGIVLS